MKFFVHNNLYYWYMYIDHTANAILIWSIKGGKEVRKLEGFCSGENIKKEIEFYRFWAVVSQAANFSLVCISLGVIPSPRIRT